MIHLAGNKLWGAPGEEVEVGESTRSIQPHLVRYYPGSCTEIEPCPGRDSPVVLTQSPHNCLEHFHHSHKMNQSFIKDFINSTVWNFLKTYVFVCLECHKKILKLGWLTKETFILHHSGGWEAEGQCTSLLSSQWEPQMVAFSLFYPAVRVLWCLFLPS